tara:strand:- start:2917 stop:3375 length:459 start_codon:yes stop_codon:yes gene_type:complete
MKEHNPTYSDTKIRNLTSVEVRIHIPMGSCESEEVSFITSNKYIIFITNNYHELRKDFFKDDDEGFLRILIDAIFSCKEISKVHKSTWRKWSIWNIEFYSRDKVGISDLAQEIYINDQIDQCYNYLTNSPVTAKTKYEIMKLNRLNDWKIYE